MNASPAEQRALLDVADLDRRARRAEASRRTPPQAARIAELTAQRTAQGHELSQLAGARDDVQAELARLESDVSVAEARRDRDASRLAATSNSKDATALEHELASLKKRLSDLEDAELDVMERLEQADAALAAQQAVIDETNAEGARLSGEAKAVVAEATAELEQIARDRAAVIGALPGELVAYYDKVAQRSTGAALFTRGTCEGCRMVLSGTDLQALRNAPADRVVNCPECGCILVRTEESGL
ncbi:MAG TPA: C4-type zinc ribbon domain-containing protein [Microbacterium sp.]|uniref:zinc ribbon domain-containing protein n=1 Tax=Microbacterium sp. TaxID=51671 RepID=UPI002BE0F50C|nr:C4-type zinc ribbon domain-containing protein [Microbacterium sp.]HWI30527.1 C4-type zinc ribbon domain-containing protein [Microbacterium sp.]